MYVKRVQFVNDNLQNIVIDQIFWEWKDQKGILSISWIGNHAIRWIRNRTCNPEGWFTYDNKKGCVLRFLNGEWYSIVPPTKEEINFVRYFLSEIEKEVEVDIKEFDLHWPPQEEQCDTLLKLISEISEGDIVVYDIDVEYHVPYYDTYHEYDE